MKTATKILIEKDVKQYIHTDDDGVYILSSDIKGITERLLSSYSNVYCFSTMTGSGKALFSVRSTRSHKAFIEIHVKSEEQV